MILLNDNEESRRMVEQCYLNHKTTLNPIIEWTDNEIWEFIRAESIPYCGLYDEGWHRLGCIGCPMARRRGREREFLRWPTYKQAYLRAFEKMLDERRRRGKDYSIYGHWQSAQDTYNWWMEYDILPGQMDLFEDGV